MKAILLGTIVILFTFGTAHALVESRAHLPENVYIPTGFDDNDNSQIVFEGNYPNTCFKAGQNLLEIDENKKTIVIKDYALYDNSNGCHKMFVYYKKVLDLGLLSAGQYTVVFEYDAGRVNKGTLNVSKSVSSNTDEKLYAPVSEVLFEKIPYTSKGKVTLKGTMTVSCMSIDKVVAKRTGESNTMDVLPLAQITDAKCVDERTPFEATKIVELSSYGRLLLHVRALSGQSLNKIVEFYP